jgi:hypothetical protein
VVCFTRVSGPTSSVVSVACGGKCEHCSHKPLALGSSNRLAFSSLSASVPRLSWLRGSHGSTAHLQAASVSPTSQPLFALGCFLPIWSASKVQASIHQAENCPQHSWSHPAPAWLWPR